MKKTLFPLLFLFTFSLSAQEWNKQQKDIINTINTAYAEGLQNEGDSLKIDQGFHPDFYLLGKGDSLALRKYAITDWRNRQIKNKASGKLPRPADREVSLIYDFIDITGDVAVAKVNYFEGELQTYVDYISLYHYGNGWKIISKIYQKL